VPNVNLKEMERISCEEIDTATEVASKYNEYEYNKLLHL